MVKLFRSINCVPLSKVDFKVLLEFHYDFGILSKMQNTFKAKLKPQRRFLALFVYLALVMSIVLVFWQVRNFDFVNYDDNVYVYKNLNVLNGLTWDGVKWAFTTGHASFWHPMTWLSLMLDCQLFGPDARGFHLVNVLLHLANTLLLFSVLKKMTSSLWPSAFVAAAFALHPMHVESVAWVTERKDVLSTFFFFLTLAAYADYVKRPSAGRYITTLTIFTIGLMAKPMLITLPFVMLLFDYWPLNRFETDQSVKISDDKNRKFKLAPSQYTALYRIIMEKIPFLVLAAVFSVITFITQKVSSGEVDAVIIHTKAKIVLFSYAAYIGKMFWPENLSMHYSFEALAAAALWQFALFALLLAGVTIMVLYFSRSRKYLPVGWFWFVGTLIPVIGLIHFTIAPYADRFTYIPYTGLFIMIAWGVPELLSMLPCRKIVLSILIVIVPAAMGISAHRQVSFWNNSFNLFSHALEVNQNDYVAYNGLGAAYGRLDRYPEAIEACKQAIKIRPDYADAYYNLGSAYGSIGRYQESIEACKQAIGIKADYAKAYYNLGVAYGGLGRYHDAIEAYQETIRIDPDYLDAFNNLGAAYYSIGRYQEAIEAYRQAIRIKPDSAACNNLGAAYGKLGRYQEEMDAYKHAIRIKPDYAEAFYNLGAAYDKLGRYQEAIEAYRQAIRIKQDYTKAHFGLGLAYLNTVEKASAMEEYKILKTLDAAMANKLFNMINK